MRIPLINDGQSEKDVASPGPYRRVKVIRVVACNSGDNGVALSTLAVCWS
jgi:hypothetical protein